MKKAFTLAEIMTVLVVIGVITCILMPSAWQGAPNENRLKFKKANATLYRVIKELVTTDRYYCKGDLGIKSDCKTLVASATDADYFCKTIADLLSTKSVNCKSDLTLGVAKGAWTLANLHSNDLTILSKTPVTEETIAGAKKKLDESCKTNASEIGAEIITTDGVVYYGSRPITLMGGMNSIKTLRLFSPPDQFPATYGDQDGFDILYKIYCIDIDGIGTGEDPFGYGIRADGNIVPGERADKWLGESIHEE